MSEKFHEKAKDAGNKLKEYILSIVTGSTGVFFFTLTGKDVGSLSCWEKGFLVAAVACFSATVILSLLEMHIDAKSFFNIARQLEKPHSQQDWTCNDRIKAIRPKLIYSTCLTISLDFLFTFIYMVFCIA
ncbi:hypothetical protein [Teredinibacter turnerae]|uniref:hypothetical protein n=1 Tax=Teredinibacter turnerae TaxID=2426 RepID=UPI000378058B|nr:hypothetical protein [Teredinibacter turnerae]